MRLQDTSRTILFLLVLVAAWASIVAVGFVLGGSRELSQSEQTARIVLSILAIICSWTLTHTLYAIHYAHIYYSDNDEDDGKEMFGGLKFPGTQRPAYMDFVYFSFLSILPYERSCARYAAVRQSLGEPDPLRLRYRAVMTAAVSEIIAAGMDKKAAAAFIKRRPIEDVPQKERARFTEVVETEVMNLHEGNIARYRLQP